METVTIFCRGETATDPKCLNGDEESIYLAEIEIRMTLITTKTNKPPTISTFLENMRLSNDNLFEKLDAVQCFSRSQGYGGKRIIGNSDGQTAFLDN